MSFSNGVIFSLTGHLLIETILFLASPSTIFAGNGHHMTFFPPYGKHKQIKLTKLSLSVLEILTVQTIVKDIETSLCRHKELCNFTSY